MYFNLFSTLYSSSRKFIKEKILWKIMKSANKFRVINIILILVALILIINLLIPLKTITTNAIYSLGREEPQCYFINKEGKNFIPLSNCCVEIQKQLKCEYSFATLEFKCFTSEKSGKYYLLNSKALNFCKKEGYYAKNR